MESQLPVEVAKIAEGVSAEKRNEVQTVLNQVFDGVSKMREQLDSVSVSNENDIVNMKLAGTLRLGVKKVRLDAEKVFDAKRAEVKQQMLSYTTEDALWLKAKQTMQILTKEIEENARWKEETRQRFDLEQKELKIQQRMLKISSVAPFVTRSEVEFMGDESFNVFYLGLEKSYNEGVEAQRKADEERIAKEKAVALHNSRKEQILPYWLLIPFANRNDDFSTLTESEWEERFQWCVSEKKKDDEAKEAQRIENEKLKAEAEAKNKEIEAERKRVEEEAKKVKEEADRKLRAEQEAHRIAVENERKEKERLQKEIREKEENELKEKKEAEAKAEAERKRVEEEARKAANTPDKEKLLEIAKTLNSLQFPELKTEEANAILTDVKTLLGKISVFITDKTSKL